MFNSKGNRRFTGFFDDIAACQRKILWIYVEAFARKIFIGVAKWRNVYSPKKLREISNIIMCEEHIHTMAMQAILPFDGKPEN